MKSFHLYSEKPEFTPDRCAPDFRPEELLELRERFRPIAELYRRFQRFKGALFGIGVGCIFLMKVLPEGLARWWFAGGFLVSFLVLLISIFLSTMPNCPNCHVRLTQRFGAFCPECGSLGVQNFGWFRGTRCLSCGRAVRGKGVRIRACTHCGVMLDEKGL